MPPQFNSMIRHRYTLILHALIPFLFILIGLSTIGYGGWLLLESRKNGQKGNAKDVDAEIDRLKAMGVKIGQLPGFPVQKLDFSGTTVCDDDLSVLDNLPDVDQIDLSKTSVTDRGLVHLRNLSQLQVLRLNEAKITDAGLVNIGDKPKLYMLHLGHTRAKLTLVNLSTFPGLRILDATGSPIEDAALANISQLAGLTGLGIRSTKIGDARLVDLKGLSQLEVLDLSATSVTDRGAAALQSLELLVLRTLLLSDCAITADGLRHLSKMRIKHLDLSGTKIHFPDAITTLGKCQTLIELVLDRTGVRNSDLKLLAPDFPQLILFQACDTAISDAGLEELGKHSNIKCIVLYGNTISADGINRFREAHPQIELRYGAAPTLTTVR